MTSDTAIVGIYIGTGIAVSTLALDKEILGSIPGMTGHLDARRDVILTWSIFLSEVSHFRHHL